MREESGLCWQGRENIGSAGRKGMLVPEMVGQLRYVVAGKQHGRCAKEVALFRSSLAVIRDCRT